MERPLVSVITIVFNGENVIGKTIESVLKQTYTNIQYIIIDGGSTDSTPSIIQHYKDRLYYWESESDRGISHAFNKGISRATGSIIGIINASDWYEEDAVEKIVKHFTNNDVIYGKLRCWSNSQPLYVQEANHTKLNREMTVNHPTVFVRKKIYSDFGFFDERWLCAMDYDLLLRFYINGVTFSYIDEILSNMQLNGKSNTNWLLSCSETLQIKNKLLPKQRIKHYLYFIKHTAAIILPRVLWSVGLGPLVVWYRGRKKELKKNYLKI
ncbi:MAG: glycosyltransferase family 2 protein [Chitinophagaceae bacterium]